MTDKAHSWQSERIGTYDKSMPGSGGKRTDLVSHVLRLQVP